MQRGLPKRVEETRTRSTHTQAREAEDEGATRKEVPEEEEEMDRTSDEEEEEEVQGESEGNDSPQEETENEDAEKEQSVTGSVSESGSKAGPVREVVVPKAKVELGEVQVCSIQRLAGRWFHDYKFLTRKMFDGDVGAEMLEEAYRELNILTHRERKEKKGQIRACIKAKFNRCRDYFVTCVKRCVLDEQGT